MDYWESRHGLADCFVWSLWRYSVRESSRLVVFLFVCFVLATCEERNGAGLVRILLT